MGGASLAWARCGVQFAAFDMKVDSGGTGVVADIGRFGDEDGVGDVSATGAPLLDGANLRSLLTGDFAIRGFELFWQGLEQCLGLLDHILDLIGPCFGVVEGVDHLLEREREL